MPGDKKNRYDAQWTRIASNERDPKRLAKLAEAGLALDEERKKHARVAEEIEQSLNGLRSFLVNEFDKADLQEIKTGLGVVRMKLKDIPIMDPDTGGWDAIQKYIVKHKAWDIIQKRLGEKACQLRWDDNKKIPGVKKFTRADIKFGDTE